MWQERREQLHEKGFEVVTVAMDTGGWDATRPFLEAAKPTHPALIDQEHSLDRLLGVVNVPTGVCTIVRPPNRRLRCRSRKPCRRWWQRSVHMQHFHRTKLIDAAKVHFEEAMRLQPENWTYKCQAWACMNPGSTPTEGYNRSWLEAVDKIGIGNYYERLDL